jgi:hypothetical protein
MVIGWYSPSLLTIFRLPDLSGEESLAINNKLTAEILRCVKNTERLMI